MEKDLTPVTPVTTVYTGRKYREEKGYTVRELAQKTFLAPSTISNWENHRKVPNLDCLIIISRALGVEPNMLYEIKETEVFKARRNN